ncbi:hypothetical protein CPAR01_03727, partial [Colletotrichum paranaense]
EYAVRLDSLDPATLESDGTAEEVLSGSSSLLLGLTISCLSSVMPRIMRPPLTAPALNTLGNACQLAGSCLPSAFLSFLCELLTSNDETEEGPRNDNEAKSLPNMSHRCCSFPQHCSFLFPMETKDDGWIAGGGTTDAGKGTAFLLASTFSFSLPARPSIAATFPLKAVRH